jgi:putative flippase GtrA
VEAELKPWREFFRFGLVGVVSFTVDASTLAIMLTAGLSVLWGRAVSYVAAATCAWALNRRWTFRDLSTRRARRWRSELWRVHPSRSSFQRSLYDLSRVRRGSRLDLRAYY